MSLTFCKDTRTGTQVCPLSFELGEHLEVTAYGLRTIPRFKTSGHFLAANHWDKVSRNSLLRPKNSGLGMLVRSAHGEDHV